MAELKYPVGESLQEVAWQDVSEPGAYVERTSGLLYRISNEAFFPGAVALVHKEIRGASHLVQVSKNPFIAAVQARTWCQRNNIVPNF